VTRIFAYGAIVHSGLFFENYRSIQKFEHVKVVYKSWQKMGRATFWSISSQLVWAIFHKLIGYPGFVCQSTDGEEDPAVRQDHRRLEEEGRRPVARTRPGVNPFYESPFWPESFRTKIFYRKTT
jgi:hypothetical protein